MPGFSEVRLQTERLELRPLKEGDEVRLFEIYTNPEFMRYWSSTPWTTVEPGIEMIAKDLRDLEEGVQIRLGIVDRHEDRLVGTCTLFRIDRQCRRAELGYGIDRNLWRRGLMHEAVSALIDFGFREMALNRIEADIDPRNSASARSLEKLGFRKEGFLRQRWIVGEEFCDSALYGLLAEDWQDKRMADPPDVSFERDRSTTPVDSSGAGRCLPPEERHREDLMLQLRPNCECCDRDLPNESPDARICTFECTFCSSCAEERLANVCPNCAGELVRRPVRAAAALARHPASLERIHRPGGCADPSLSPPPPTGS